MGLESFKQNDLGATYLLSWWTPEEENCFVFVNVSVLNKVNFQVLELNTLDSKIGQESFPQLHPAIVTSNNISWYRSIPTLCMQAVILRSLISINSFLLALLVYIIVMFVATLLPGSCRLTCQVLMSVYNRTIVTCMLVVDTQHHHG